MKRGALLVMIFSILAFNLNGCSCNNINAENNVANSIGNYSCNIAERGLVAKQGNWIYYYCTGGSFGIGEGLYKSKIDGSQREKVVSGEVSNINVLGDWIYYVLTEKSRKNTATVYRFNLYRIKTDGSQKTIVLNDCNNVNIINDKIYYKIYIETMGYQKAGISDYPLKEENGNVYSIMLDGSQKTKLISKSVRRFIVIGDCMYYSDDSALYRTNTNGANTEMIISDKIDGFKVDNSKIYYFANNINNKESIISIFDLSSNNKKSFKIQDKLLLQLLPYQDSVFYITSNFKTYRIKDSGEGEQEIAKNVLNLYGFNEYILGWNGEKNIKTIEGL